MPFFSRSAAKAEQDKVRNQRTNRMLISMVVVFGIGWLPLNTINFIADLNVFPIWCWEFYHFVFFICHVMAMSSTCYNPFLYGCYNEAFNKEFTRLIPGKVLPTLIVKHYLKFCTKLHTCDSQKLLLIVKNHI